MEAASKDPTLEALSVRKTFTDGSARYGTAFDECRFVVKNWCPDWKFLTV